MQWRVKMTSNNQDIDVTIAFSGYNIKNFAILGIESFLYFNPHLRGNVVYFDDLSTDGTKEELERRGIRVITWLPEELKDLTDTGHANSLYIRCSCIYGSIVKRTTTKYLFLIDGDAAFINNDFFSSAMERIREEKALCIGARSLICIPDDVCEGFLQDEAFGFIRKYLTKFTEDSYFNLKPETVGHLVNGCRIEFTPGDYYTERMLTTHMIVDAETLHKHGVYADIFEDIIRGNDFPFGNGVFDTGASWLYQMKALGYPIIDVPYSEIRASIIHFDAVSSQLKYPHTEPLWRAINYIKRDPGVARACSYAGISKDSLVLDIMNGTKNKEYVQSLAVEFGM